VNQVVNLGERGRPMNGAVWQSATGWPLASHMGSDFSDQVLQELDAAKPGEVIALNSANAQFKAFVLGPGSAATGLAIGRDQTGSALGKALRAVGRAFKAAVTFHWK
jgi:hypothetical protein